MAGKSSPKKPSFFKVLLDDFSQHLRIEHAFVENFNGQSLHECSRRGSSGQLWAVKLEERENGLFFHGGWQGSVKDHSLEIGNFFIFDYDGDSKFEVTIYDKSAREKDVELARRRSGNPVSSMNKGSRARVKDEILDLDQTKIYNKDTESKTNIADKSRKTIPKKLAIAEGLTSKKTIALEDPAGRSWLLKLKVRRSPYVRFEITRGWGKICKANQILSGDTIIFEFVKPSVMQIYHTSKIKAIRL